MPLILGHINSSMELHIVDTINLDALLVGLKWSAINKQS